jgi:hypothetical protein
MLIINDIDGYFISKADKIAEYYKKLSLKEYSLKNGTSKEYSQSFQYF